MNDAGLKLIKGFEGFEGWPYEDAAGKLTIGYGHLLPLTESEASVLLVYKLFDYVEAVDALVKVPLTDNQHNALVSFVYNVGITAFRKSTLLKKLNSGDYASVPKQLARWNRAGGRVLQGLVKRRAAEATLWGMP